MDEAVKTKLAGQVETLNHRIPIPERLSPEQFELEREKIFRPAWIPVANAGDLPKPGSYLIKDFELFNTSLIIVRGSDDVIRAFHNICVHRGNKLIRSGVGCRRNFRCGFHGWVYSTEGELINVTDAQAVKDLDMSKMGLPPIKTENWNGLIFVNFDDQDRFTLKNWMGDWYGQYDGYFTSHEKAASNYVDLNCNWSLAVNSFCEGYHTMFIHANTMGDYQGGKKNPQRRRPYFEMAERHNRYSAPANPDHKRSPAEKIAYANDRPLIIPSFGMDSSDTPQGINPGNSENWAFDVQEFFPNFVLLSEKNWHIELYFMPIDHQRTRIQVDVFHYPAKKPSDRISQEFALSRGRNVILEDLNTLEAQQKGLMSGAISHVHLTQQEMALQHHWKVYSDMMEAN
ncbi:MAG: aromatic ring-hydroxylating dioxygenase subunit alpha [Rhodospirillales bacterium]|nr:aromatic ring-hydroxylating dioxygenase subunit alpha [Rhodospirillales bacterium]